jgi:uncharacterized membrane-anchored protein YitT (DUF2179 family)
MINNLYNKNNLIIIIDYTVITIGCLLMALGIGVFLIDAKVVPGGASGLAMAIHYLTNNKIGVGMITWALNIPLFIYGIKELGKEFGIRTFYGFTASSFFTDMVRGDFPGLSFIRLQDSPSIKYLFNNDFFFFVLIGAVLLGVGLGFIFKFRATTGGSDIIAAIMHKKWGVKTGNAIIMIDFLVIFIAGIVLNVKHLANDKPVLVLVLYAFFLVFVSSKIIDIVLDGFDYARSVLIFSDKKDEIGKVIMEKMNRGVTALKSRGLYRNTETEVIYTVITLKELGKLTDLVKSIDSQAFVVITMVHEVVGHGFRRRI